ncbi:hypothetical protein [Enterococcus sp. AZ196]|uniref:hypothetical protein n=1 Tax=Enterococcus sp. AZ196 TaxID=2774659 RepID=UPI003D2B0E54
MYLLGILSVGLIVLAIILTIVRLLFDLRFAAIQKEPDQSPLFRRKVNYLRKLEQARHIRYLLLTSLVTGVALVLFIGSFLLLAEDHQKLKRKNIQLEKRVEGMEHRQEQLILSIPLKNYPEDGIGLKTYEWDKLASEVKDSTLQNQMEAEITRQTMPYFGSVETSVSLSEPKTMSLQLKGQMEDEASKETIQKNIDRFAKEAEGVSELTAIHVRMNASVGKEKKVVYSVNYFRENGEGVFNKKNVSEQNLKNDGEKG